MRLCVWSHKPLWLSVSSTGSTPLQSTIITTNKTDDLTFSILYRIDTSAMPVLLISIYAPALSLSSTGSTPLQCRQTLRRPQICSFQYPLPDRHLCNLRLACPCLRDDNFQYPQPDRQLCNLYAVLLCCP